MAEERLQKILSEAGVASRRKAEEMIRKGQVQVNGHTAALGDKADPRRDKVTVRGQLLQADAPQHIYLMLHKPRGYITTMADEKGRKCVAELIKDVPGRVYPVGRLDRESEGLLLLTNDGDFANTMTHPGHEVSKTYRVTVRPGITEEQLTRLCVGVPLDGKPTAPAQVHVLSKEPGRVVLEFTLHEGRNREIRRMCEEVGLQVARLKRIAIGPLRLGMLQPGQWRNLEIAELRALRESAVKREKAGRRKR